MIQLIILLRLSSFNYNLKNGKVVGDSKRILHMEPYDHLRPALV